MRERGLSPRQKKVLDLAASGITGNKFIAQEMGISVSTVKNHLNFIYQLYEISGSNPKLVSAINKAIERGDIEIHEPKREEVK